MYIEEVYFSDKKAYTSYILWRTLDLKISLLSNVFGTAATCGRPYWSIFSTSKPFPRGWEASFSYRTLNQLPRMFHSKVSFWGNCCHCCTYGRSYWLSDGSNPLREVRYRHITLNQLPISLQSKVGFFLYTDFVSGTLILIQGEPLNYLWGWFHTVLVSGTEDNNRFIKNPDFITALAKNIRVKQIRPFWHTVHWEFGLVIEVIHWNEWGMEIFQLKAAPV